MQKILLVDSSREFCESLLTALGRGYEARICKDGLQALEILEQFQPDILVTALALSGLDGLSLLKMAAERPEPPALVATTRLGTPYVQGRMEQLGVAHLFVKPCNLRILAERIRDLTQAKPQLQLNPYSTAELVTLLRDMNVNMSRRTCKYLISLIELYLEDPHRSLTKELYPAVGSRCDSNGLAVERAVRSLIEDAWSNRDEQLWRRYFPMDRHGVVIKPTNRCFLAAVAMALQINHHQMA